MQLARACLSFGYSFVAPASWGEELLAVRATDFVASGPAGASLLFHCPLVVAVMGSAGANSLPRCAGVSPPVATSRYLRAAFSPKAVHVTYVGRCPGGLNSEIDEHLSPDTLLARLAQAGCSPTKEPSYFDDVLPPDRRRFASTPGGAPAPGYLATTVANAIIRDVAPETLHTVAAHCGPNERSLLDLAVAMRCHCAVDAYAMQRLEPLRAAAAVVNLELMVDLAPSVRASPHTPTRFPRFEAVGSQLTPPAPLDDAPLTPLVATEGMRGANDVATGERQADKKSLMDAARGPDSAAPIAVAAEIDIVGRVVRRPVQVGYGAPALDATSRLSRRLPGRASVALVTHRPPDATEPTSGDSTSPVRRP
ncbi:MAG: hypothetical protein ABI877_08010 [Gemmatimonadaceae bacterium]